MGTGIDRTIAGLAGGQHGVVSRGQLLRADVSRGAIDHRVAIGRLLLLHHGVYAVGHGAIGRRGRHLAALLACGPRAALSHHSAALEWGLLAAEPSEIHVTAPERRVRPRIRTHEAELADADLRRRDGLLLTSPARTLLDLAAHLSTCDLERVLERARVDRLLGPDDLADLAARVRRRRGAARLAALLDGGPAFTRSAAERKLLALVARAGLPRPRTNVHTSGYEVDALWPHHRLVLEVDGFGSHGTRTAFERDRRRDVDLAAAGHLVVRVTWNGLTRHPEMLAARLGAALATRAG